MKKLVAFILVLALCLSLCSVTAFAGETIDALNVTHSELDYKSPETLELNSNNEKVTTGFELHLLNDFDIVYGYNSEVGWISVEEGYIEKNQVDFTKVNKAQWALIFNTDDTFKSDGFTLTVNDKAFEERDKTSLLNGKDGYCIEDSYDHLEIFIWQDISGDDDDGCNLDCETLAKGVAIAAGITVVTVGTIHTVKAVGKAVKTAVVMPCVVHAMKWAVPAALAALCRAVWHLR